MSKSKSRRDVVIGSAKAAAGVATLAALGGMAAARKAEAASMSLGADITKHCVTCKFWGGQRHVSKDGKTVMVSSLGYCNNPKSPNYQKVTQPETGPMQVWEKWGALG